MSLDDFRTLVRAELVPTGAEVQEEASPDGTVFKCTWQWKGQKYGLIIPHREVVGKYEISNEQVVEAVKFNAVRKFTPEAA